MLFSSGAEFFLVITFLFLQWFVRVRFDLRFSRAVLLMGNMVLLGTVINPTTLLLHIVLSVFVFITGLTIQRNTAKSAKWVALSILVLIILFVLRNYPKAFGFSDFRLGSNSGTIIQRLGISYILFRHIQYIVDCHRKRVVNFHVVDYINFILFFPNFLAGPIDKYTNFKRNFDRKEGKLKRALIGPGMGRIFIGFIKKYLIVPVLYSFAISYDPFMEFMGPQLAVFSSILLYSLYIYLDFSGYSDIAIGTGYIMGIKTPENFDAPYLARNISDFWKRWHMTFSQFLRDMIFIPVVRGLNRIGLSRFRLGVTVLGYVITFFICGIWHGDTVNFVYWGLWHALGLSLYRIWRELNFVKKTRENIRLSGLTWLWNISSIVFNFTFVSIGWIFFNYSGENLTTAVELILGIR